ncbi:MAG TPA: NlpC/P60 family protein [Devosia sp.]|nr:NlpC/P60 family protein [Devosia sp.]
MTPRLAIPAYFLSVPYNAAMHPGAAVPADLSSGANCQVFAYALLAHFGIDFPPLRSSELWADTRHSHAVTEFQPLDLLVFGKSADAFGAHVAVYVGEGRAIHLSRTIGLPEEWTIEDFARHENYRVLIGGKRPYTRV